MSDSGNAKKGKKGAEQYLNFLAEEGYRPWIDANGDVAFKCEGGHYFIHIFEDDKEYFRLVYPNFWRIKNGEELSRVKETALDVTDRYKAVKILLSGDTNTWAAVELFCSPPQTFTAVFNRSLRALRSAVKDFIAMMQEPSEQDDFVFHLPKYTVGGN